MSDFKVRIVGGDGAGLVRFEASSIVSENRTANYEGFNIIHLPTSLWAYRNTNGRHFSINGKLVSRTPSEARANAGYLTTVRRWMLPDFGDSGAPPPIVFLSAYNNRQINSVPCVVLSYSWSFPEEVDYIYGTPEPMPVIGTLNIDLEEAYSAEQITAGAWKMKQSPLGGNFTEFGERGNSSTGGSGASLGGPKGSLLPPFGPGFKGIASSFNGFPSLGGALTLSPGIIAKFPTMAGSIIGAATNSPLLSTVAQEAVGLLNNRFISGNSQQQILDNSNVSNKPTYSPKIPTIDPFGRSTDNYPPTVYPNDNLFIN